VDFGDGFGGAAAAFALNGFATLGGLGRAAALGRRLLATRRLLAGRTAFCRTPPHARSHGSIAGTVSALPKPRKRGRRVEGRGIRRRRQASPLTTLAAKWLVFQGDSAEISSNRE